MGVCSAVASPASAITINNPSFEYPYTPSFTYNVVESWNSTDSPQGSYGIFNPTPDYYFTTTVPDGSQVAYVNSGSISQTLSATLTANTNYSLSVYVGNRKDGNGLGGVNGVGQYNVELFAGTSPLASNNSIDVLVGTFAQVLVLYTSPGSGLLIGQPLEIRLSRVGGIQANFDNVTLTSTPVPLETDALPIVVAAAFMAGGLWWKKKRAQAQTKLGLVGAETEKPA